MKTLAETIRDEALRLGYEQCGLIAVEEMHGYGSALKERIKRFPDTAPYYQNQIDYADLKQKYPWAKTIVVCANYYGKYHIPEFLNGSIAKYYLADSRLDPNSSECHASCAFEKFMQSLGLVVATNRKFGITAMRYAAVKAGIGIMRKNNFFYSEHGSWYALEAFLIDAQAELKTQLNLKPCPKSCTLCQKACPTNALEGAYTLNFPKCISFLTTFGGRDLINEPSRSGIGQWIYGCDACQDTCPFNRGQWRGDTEFPGLAEITPLLTWENLLESDEAALRKKLSAKFWYLSPEDVWKWKVNVLNAILNRGDRKFLPLVEKASRDPNPKVAAMARFVKEQCK